MTYVIGLMKLFFTVLFLSLTVVLCRAQSFIFDDAESYADFSIRKDGKHLICFYKTTASNAQSSHYRTIAFDSILDITDTIGFRLPGVCKNLGSGENEKYIWHIFHTTVEKQETISFLITDKAGNKVAAWEKKADDFKQFFGKNFKKLGRLQFNTMRTEGELSEMVLVEPLYYTKSGVLDRRGRWMALNILDGSVRWELSKPVEFLSAKAVNGMLVAFQLSNYTYGMTELHYYSLQDGKENSLVKINAQHRGRKISVFEINKDEIVIAGRDDEQNSNSKHSKFFLTRFDYTGRQVFDKLDTAERLSGNRMMLLGGAQASNGDLILIGESYKLDAKAAVAGAAASVALSILVGASYVNVPPVKNIVFGVVSARISPAGDVQEFHLFPVDKRNGFSELIRDERQVYLRYQNLVLWYDLTNLATPPRSFTVLTPNQEIITFCGNLISVRKDVAKQEIILENLASK